MPNIRGLTWAVALAAAAALPGCVFLVGAAAGAAVVHAVGEDEVEVYFDESLVTVFGAARAELESRGGVESSNLETGILEGSADGATVRIEITTVGKDTRRCRIQARRNLGVSPDAETARAVAESMVQHQGRLELRGAGRPLAVDFLELWRRRGAGARSEAVVRAVGAHRAGPGLRVLDATAGLGRDAFLLALAGCRVLACERSPVIAALFADGLRRAAAVRELAPALPQLHCGDAREWLGRASFDVVYLDPMHPQRRKSALVKKEMRWFRALVGADADAGELFAAAAAAGCPRIVVKRPRHGPPLAPAPAHALVGRSTRFDVYLPRPA